MEKIVIHLVIDFLFPIKKKYILQLKNNSELINNNLLLFCSIGFRRE